MSNLKQRVVAGIAANATGHAITISIQLASLPLFLSRWGAADYGIWLMLSAVPAYFSMSDVGMVTAAGNRMTMSMGRGDVKETNRVFQSAFVFMLIVCCTIAAISMPLIMLAPFPGLSDGTRRIALSALVLGVLLAMFNGLAEAVFRATSRYGLGTFLANCLRLFEWSGAMAGLFLFGDFASVAIGSLLARTTGMLALVALSRRDSRGIRWGWSEASLSEVRALVTPAVLFMVFPLASALSLQGYTLLVGSLFGSAAVALFSTYRTLARVAVQATSTLSMAVGPELSRLRGAGDIAGLTAAYRRANQLGIGIAAALSITLCFMAPTLLGFWTHHAITYVQSLMFIILLYAAVTGFWHVPRILLLSINHHRELAGLFLAVSLASLALGYAMGKTMGLTGLATALLLSEVAVAVGCTVLVHRYLSANRNLTSTARPGPSQV